MSRHIVDHTAPKAEGSGLRYFLDLARREYRHPAIVALNRRPRKSGPQKLMAFLRIAHMAHRAE